MVRPARIEKILDGIVVRMTNYGESDRIVEFITAEEGRVSMIARGARRSRKRFGGCLDLFAGLRTHAQPGSNLWMLKSVDALNLRLELRLNFDLLARASLICDCARALTPEHHEATDMYEAVRGGLDMLTAGDAVGASHAYPLILQAAGILPDTSQLLLEPGIRYGLFRSVRSVKPVDEDGGTGLFLEVEMLGGFCTKHKAHVSWSAWWWIGFNIKLANVLPVRMFTLTSFKGFSCCRLS